MRLGKLLGLATGTALALLPMALRAAPAYPTIVASMAALKALPATSMSLTQNFVVSCYDSSCKTPLNAGFRWLAANATYTANGISIIAPSDGTCASKGCLIATGLVTPGLAGADLTGATGTATAISNACVAATAVGQVLTLTPGIYRLQGNLVTACDTMHQQGAVIRPDGGVSWAPSGHIFAGRWQIMDLVNNPVVLPLGSNFMALIGHPQVSEIPPEWFKLANDGVTDDSQALNMASFVAHNAYLAGGAGGTASFGATIVPPSGPMLMSAPFSVYPSINVRCGTYGVVPGTRITAGARDQTNQTAGTGCEFQGGAALENYCGSSKPAPTVYVIGGNVTMTQVLISGYLNSSGAATGTALQLGKSGRSNSSCFETGNINGPSGLTFNNVAITQGNPGVEFNGVADTKFITSRFDANISDYGTYTTAFNQVWFDTVGFSGGGGPRIASNGAGMEMHFIHPQVNHNAAVNEWLVGSSAALAEYYFDMPWVVSNSNGVAAGSFISYAPQSATASVTGTVAVGGLMTVTAVGSGTIAIGQRVTGTGLTGTNAGQYVQSFITGTGNTGTYMLSGSNTATGSITITMSDAPHVLQINGGRTDSAILLPLGTDGANQGGVEINGVELTGTQISVNSTLNQRFVNNHFYQSQIIDNGNGLLWETIQGNQFYNTSSTGVQATSVAHSSIMGNVATGGVAPITNGLTETGACVMGNTTDSGTTLWNPLATGC